MLCSFKVFCVPTNLIVSYIKSTLFSSYHVACDVTLSSCHLLQSTDGYVQT
jgi:hypothetical protein